MQRVELVRDLGGVERAVLIGIGAGKRVGPEVGERVRLRRLAPVERPQIERRAGAIARAVVLRAFGVLVGRRRYCLKMLLGSFTCTPIVPSTS